MIAKHIYNRLSSTGELTRKIADRIWPEVAVDNNETPYVVYSLIDDVDDVSLLGLSNRIETRVQVDCWSATMIEARELAIAVRDALISMSGTFGDVVIQTVRPDGRRSNSEPENESGGQGLFGVSGDFVFSWHEPPPPV